MAYFKRKAVSAYNCNSLTAWCMNCMLWSNGWYTCLVFQILRVSDVHTDTGSPT